MPFTQSSFAPIGGQNSPSPSIWSYRTADLIADVIAAEYFNDKKFELERGDQLFIIAFDGGGLYAYSDSSSPLVGIENTGSTRATNVVYINRDEDFPNVVGGVSTLEPNTKYVFSPFSTGIRVIAQEGTCFEGSGVFGGTLVYTGTGSWITSTNVTVCLQNFSFSSPNAQVIDATGSSLDSVTLFEVQLTGCLKLGTFNGLGIAANNCGWNSFQDGWSFKGGPIVGFSVVNVFMGDANPLAVYFDIDDATFLDFELLNVYMVGEGVGISSSIGAANLVAGLEAEIANNTFDIFGRMTPLSGFPNGFQQNQWNFKSNSPFSTTDDTRQDADIFLLDANTITVSVAADWYEVGTPTVGSWASDVSNRFTLNSAGYLEYTGDKDIDVRIIATATVENTGGAADFIEGRIAVNWAGAADGGLAKSRSATDNISPTSITMIALTTISPGDNIRLIFANLDDTTNIIVNVNSLNITTAV